MAFLAAQNSAGNLTCDGIDLCGERLAEEVYNEVWNRKKNGASYTAISLVAYSLGGLVSRYAIGALYRRGVFDTVTPLNFITFATPHLGTRKPGCTDCANVECIGSTGVFDGRLPENWEAAALNQAPPMR